MHPEDVSFLCLNRKHIRRLVASFQKVHGLPSDGLVSPDTYQLLNNPPELVSSLKVPARRFYPLGKLQDGRRPVVTQGFRTVQRPDHTGVDIAWPPVFDDQSNGTHHDNYALAAADGIVQIATKTCCWIIHDSNVRTGYFHVEDLLVDEGDTIRGGSQLGTLSRGYLHFEVSLVENYAPMDPTTTWLTGARLL